MSWFNILAGSVASGGGGGHATAPAFVAATSVDAETSSTLNCTTSISAGETVIVSVGLFLSGGSVSSVIGGGTYTKIASLANPEDGRLVNELWACLSASSSASTVTVTLSGAANSSATVARYTGVSSFGNNGTASNSAGVYSDTTHSISLTMQDTNNRIVSAGIVRPETTATATVGSFRANAPEFNHGSFDSNLIDNMSSSAGSLAATYTTSAGVLWNAVAVELRSNP